MKQLRLSAINVTGGKKKNRKRKKMDTNPVGLVVACGKSLLRYLLFALAYKETGTV